jgi:hypothetical protein
MDKAMPFLNDYLTAPSLTPEERLGCAKRWSDVTMNAWRTKAALHRLGFQSLGMRSHSATDAHLDDNVCLIEAVAQRVLDTETNTAVPDDDDPTGLRLWHGAVRPFDLAEMNRCWQRLRLAVTQLREICQAAQQTAEAAHKAQPNTEDVAPRLTELEYAILQHLARLHPQLVKITDLAVEVRCGRTTASKAVARLESMAPPLVERPEGERSGVGITPAGVATLRPCDLPPALTAAALSGIIRR